jgi:ferritin
MLIGERLNAAINQQIQSEFGASAQYVAIAVYFDQQALPVLAQHFYRQAEEERMHAMKFVKYLVETGGKVIIPPTPAVKNDLASAEECLQLSLNWEVEVTRQINHLMDIAREENDYLAQQFLQWFVNEQLEEVSSMDALLKTIRRVGEGGLLWVEEYLTRAAAMGGGEAEGDGEA